MSLLCCLAILIAVPAAAQLNGHNLRGDYGLSSGTQLPPGIWVGLLYPNYDVNELRGRDGHKLPFTGDINVQALVPWVWWVSKTKIFGGTYSIFLAPSWTDSALEAPILGLESDTGIGRGDLYFQPINLGWHTERADFMAGAGVYAPIGRHEEGADDNTGLGMWSYETFAGTTLYLNKARTWNLAATAFYETHSSKEDSQKKVGDILTIEGGLGRSFAGGALNVGVAYFAQWKVTEDDLGLEGKLRPAALGISKHRVYGAGPEITLPLGSKKKLYGFLTLRYLLDFGVESNTQGNTFLFNLTVPVPSIPL